MKWEEAVSYTHLDVYKRQVVKELGTIINVEKDLVKVYGKEVSLDTKKVYYMLNKPQGVISAVSYTHLLQHFCYRKYRVVNGKSIRFDSLVFAEFIYSHLMFY